MLCKETMDNEKLTLRLKSSYISEYLEVEGGIHADDLTSFTPGANIVISAPVILDQGISIRQVPPSIPPSNTKALTTDSTDSKLKIIDAQGRQDILSDSLIQKGDIL